MLFIEERIKILEKELKLQETKKWREALVTTYLENLGHNQLQIRKLLRPSVHVRCYNKDAICQAIALRSMSKRAYEFLGLGTILPLPSRKILSNWLSEYPCPPGIQHDFLNIVENVVWSTKLHKQAVLLFDEVDIKSEYQYESRLKLVLKPAKKMQVVILRGLLEPWKQVIFYDFDKNRSKKLFLDIVTACQSVRGAVFDMGNHTFIKDCKLMREGNNFLPNPNLSGKKIYLFPDVPHLLKRFRDHTLDYGIRMPGFSIIGGYWSRRHIHARWRRRLGYIEQGNFQNNFKERFK